MKVWLDDKRPMPEGYTDSYISAFDAIAALQSGKVTHISLDHDLGLEDEYGNGYMVAKWIEEGAYLKILPKLEWHIHSQNSVGVARMRMALENADRYWLTSE